MTQQCEICGDGPMVLVCAKCDDDFSDLAHLAAHVKAMHPDDYPDDFWPDGSIVYFEEEVA